MVPTIRPTHKQHLAYEALRDPLKQFVFFGGGAGGGKSWLGCEWEITNAYFYPGIKSFIGREELKRLMTSSFVTFMKVCKFHQIPREDWLLNSKYNFIEFRNGSRIDLLDLKHLPTDPFFERLGSLEYTNGWIEEAGEINFGAFDVLKSRVGRHMNKEYGLSPKILSTCNPKKNWVYSTVYKPFKEGRLPSEYAFIQSLYRDNPHTADEYEKQLQSITDKVTKARLKDGIWEYDADPGTLINYEAMVDLFTNTVDESDDRYLIADVARFGADKIVIYLFHGLKLAKIYIYKKQGVDQTALTIRDIAKLERVPYSHILIDEDGVGGGVVDLLPGVHGFIANSAPLPNPRTEEPENYVNLKSQCSYKLADMINNHRIAIDVNLVATIEEITPERFKEMLKEELEYIKAKNVDNDSKKKQVVPKDEIKESLGRSPDLSDPLMMRMWFELPKRLIEEDYHEDVPFIPPSY